MSYINFSVLKSNKLWVNTYVHFIVVISEPGDIVICEGEQATFTCRLDGIKKDDVRWYRFIKDTNTTEMVDQDGNDISFTTRTVRHVIRSSIIIRKSYNTGYYWVGTPYFNVCNVSLTVETGMYVAS